MISGCFWAEFGMVLELFSDDTENKKLAVVDTTLFTVPNKPSNTSLCVCVPSKVPVSPTLYGHFSNFVKILVILLNF